MRDTQPYKTILFAAGRGIRMMPLTAERPKPLLKASGKALIIWQIEALARAGFRDIVINASWCGEQFEPALGDGSQFGVRLSYSFEPSPLETVGGIVKAASALGFEPFLPEEPHPKVSLPFLSVSADVYTDFDYARLIPTLQAIANGAYDAHFVLTENPPFHLAGDFALRDGVVAMQGEKWNYGGIACWHPKLFAGLSADKRKLFPWAYPFVEAGRVSGEFHPGEWDNVGTPRDLANLSARLDAAIDTPVGANA